MNKYTPGPWRAWIRGNTIEVQRGQKKAGRVVAIAAWPGFDGCDIASIPTQAANARLMAASPDLLSALKDAVQDLQDWADDNADDDGPFIVTERGVNAALLAIAKAEGMKP